MIERSGKIDKIVFIMSAIIMTGLCIFGGYLSYTEFAIETKQFFGIMCMGIFGILLITTYIITFVGIKKA